MKSLLVFIGMFLSAVICFTQNAKPPKNDPYNPPYAPNTILVKFKDAAPLQVVLRKGAAGGLIVMTGIPAIDSLHAVLKITSFEKVFADAQPRTEEKTFTDRKGMLHEPGRLDKIYKLKYDAAIDAKEAAKKYFTADSTMIDYAEPDYYCFTQVLPEKNKPFVQDALYNQNLFQHLLPKCNAYKNDGPILSGDPYKPLFMPSDPLLSNQWYLDSTAAIQARQAWNLETGDTTQVIGIIDTGVDWQHPDLASKIWTNKDEVPNNNVDDDGNGKVDDVRSWDWVNGDNNPMDDNSHGTHVAGIAAAATNNNVGIAGIAWGAKIMALKVMQSSGYGSSSDIAAGINYANSKGATILNLSLGSYAESQTMKTALENAYTNCVIVAAAGNDGYKVDPPPPPAYSPMYPACYPWVIGVQASTQSDTLTPWSNYDPSGPVIAGNPYGHNYEIIAPGLNIYSTAPNSGYKTLSGTSMATPIVSGSVALLKSYQSNLSNEQVMARIIQGSTNGILNIYGALTNTLAVDLHYVSYSLVDTLQGDDNDGHADAGETIQTFLTVKNTGANTKAVYAKWMFAPYEDTTVASIMIDSSYIGNISTYATLNGSAHPFKIFIKTTVANNRDIMFMYKIFDSTNVVKDTGFIKITVQKGEQLQGYYQGKKILTADKFYIVPNSFVCDSLIIKPGTTIRISAGKSIQMYYLEATGKPDSMITFTINGNGNWASVHFIGSGSKPKLEYCIFENAGNYFTSHINLENCIAINCNGPNHDGSTTKSVYINTPAWIYSPHQFQNNVTAGNTTSVATPPQGYNNNNIFIRTSNNTSQYIITANCAMTGFGLYKMSPNYYGTRDSAKIESSIYDFFEGGSCILRGFDSALVTPPSQCHGVVWKVLINGTSTDTTNFVVDIDTVKFDVYFNRSMRKSHTPFLTFGVITPYTQHVVSDSASWNSDSTIWTAYYKIGLYTGDGINKIRVYGAQDTEGFDIPTEDSRFQFTIEAAGSQSNNFMATAGVGKVALEWPPTNSPDTLGYNMYRDTSATFNNPTKINAQLITNYYYTDYAVTPMITYHYKYKVVSTNLIESDYSKKVYAKPDSAVKGDANGDSLINIADVVTIVSYLLGQNPQPFLTAAADKNIDGQINVLDIVALINKILGKNPKYNAKLGSPLLTYNQRQVNLNDVGGLCAVQFRIVGKNLKKENVVPGELMKGMEYAYHVIDDTMMVVIYNFNNRSFASDKGVLLSLDNGEILYIDGACGSNPLGTSIPIKVQSLTEVEELARMRKGYFLAQNYPNPFGFAANISNAVTTILYGLADQQSVTIDIYNILGQKVKSFFIQVQNAGQHAVIWDGTNERMQSAPSGFYIYRITAGKFNDQKAMVLIK